MSKLTAVLVVSALLAYVAPASAQTPKPKPKPKPAADAGDTGDDTPAAKPAKPAKPKAAKPKPSDAAPGTSKPAGKPGKTPAPLPEAAQPDAGVEAVLASKPRTPAELVRAAKLLADLHRPDLAKKFLQQVLDAGLDDPALVKLAEEVGTATFAQMSARAELRPESKKLSDLVLGAVDRHARNPVYLAALVQKLQAPSDDERSLALAALQQAGPVAVEPLLAVLADPKRAAEQPNVRAALARLGAAAVGPLVAAVDSSDPQIAAPAIRALGDLKARDAAIYLLAPLTDPQGNPQVRAAAEATLRQLTGATASRSEAARLLLDKAREYLQHRQSMAGAIDGRVGLWHIDASGKHLQAQSYAVEDASLAVAARLAREASRLVPDQAAAQRLHVITMLEAAAYEHGRDAPLDTEPGSPLAEAAKIAPPVLQDILQEAMRDGHPAAATLIARVLGKKGTADLLLGRHGEPAPLVLAARSPDRRLRMAALEAIVHLAPVHPFPGASYVTEELAFFAGSSGQRRMLSAARQSEAARRTAADLTALGYAIDTVTTGRDLVRLALASPDYDFAVVDVTIEEPTADMAIQELRRDCRTADLPVILIARSGWLERAEQLAGELPRVAAFPRPHGVEDLKWQVAQLTQTVARDFVPFAVRQQQAARALELLAVLSKQPEEAVDRRRLESAALTALRAPTLSIKAIPVVASLGTPECQRALVDVASQASEPLEVRKAAVLAFAQSTRHFGILLTTGELKRQYERYNQSQSQDPATQRILGLLLDTLEVQTLPAGKKPKPKDAAPASTKPAH